jgi:ribose/xylose/arabinose/galactoside ABC-type transport system permease subunit
MAMRKKVQADYDNFLLDNSTRIARDPFSFVGIVALGMTLVILTGGIDLSEPTMSL